MYLSLGDAHCTALHTFLSTFINELVHGLVLLLFNARFLLILASTALRRIQFLLLLFQVYLFAFPQSFGTRKTEVRHLNTCLLSTYLRERYLEASFVLRYFNTLSIFWHPKD
jgi:hypothetical protein